MIKLSISKHFKWRLKLNRGNISLPIIFLFSIWVLINILWEPVGLSVSILVYTILALLLNRSVKIYYNKKKFLTAFKIVAHPIITLVILFTLLRISFLSSFMVIVSLTWLFSLALFTSFVANFWLDSMRRRRYQHQTVWIYHQARKYVKWYLISLVVLIISSIILRLLFPILPIMEYLFFNTYFALLYNYIILLFIANIGFIFVSKYYARKYCEISLIEIRKGLESYGKGGYQDKRIFIKNYMPIFPTVVELFNNLVEDDYRELLPSIPDSDIYKKSLFASALKDEDRLRKTGKGIEKMINAVKVSKLNTPIDFTGFVEGLCAIKGKTSFSSVPESFEIQPGLGRSLSKINVGKIIGVIFVVISIYVSVLVGAPESGYAFVKEYAGEDVAKWFFPIGEASLEIPDANVELISYSGSKLNGQCMGVYSFYIKNEHRKNIEIESIIVTGPESITEIGINTPANVMELVKIENIKIEMKKEYMSPPPDPTEDIVYTNIRKQLATRFTLEHDLRALENYLENFTDDYLIVYGETVQLLISYKIMGTEIRQTISENMPRFHFRFKSSVFFS